MCVIFNRLWTWVTDLELYRFKPDEHLKLILKLILTGTWIGKDSIDVKMEDTGQFQDTNLEL